MKMKQALLAFFGLVVFAGLAAPVQAQPRHRHCFYRHHHRHCEYR